MSTPTGQRLRLLGVSHLTHKLGHERTLIFKGYVYVIVVLDAVVLTSI